MSQARDAASCFATHPGSVKFLLAKFTPAVYHYNIIMTTNTRDRKSNMNRTPAVYFVPVMLSFQLLAKHSSAAIPCTVSTWTRVNNLLVHYSYTHYTHIHIRPIARPGQCF